MPIKFRCYHCKKFMGISRGKAGNVVDCPTCGRTVRVPELDGTVKPLPPVGLNLDDSKLKNALNHLTTPEEAPDLASDFSELKGELQQLIDQPDESPADSDRINVIDPGPVEPDDVIELPLPEQKPAIELPPVDALPTRPAPLQTPSNEGAASKPPVDDQLESPQPDAAHGETAAAQTTAAVDQSDSEEAAVEGKDPDTPPHEEQVAPDPKLTPPDESPLLNASVDDNREAVIGKLASTSLADSFDETVDFVDTAKADSSIEESFATDPTPRADIPADLLATLGTVSESSKADPSSELPSQEPSRSSLQADPARTPSSDSNSDALDSTPVATAPKPEIVESQPTLDSATIKPSELKQELDALAAMAPATTAGSKPSVTPPHKTGSKSVMWTLAAFCVFAGFLIGRSFGGGTSNEQSGEAQKTENKESKPSSKPAKAEQVATNHALTGRITYRTALDESLPDSGARVLLLPRQATVEEQLQFEGLRPGDADEVVDSAAKAVARANGVAVTVSNDGTFTAEVPQTGNYHVLVFSKFHRRGNDDNLTPEMQQALDDYFPEADHRKLLGQWGIAYGRIRIDGKKPVPWDHVFQ